MSYYFTSESVSSGHPDKVCDIISDAILDAFLAQDPDSKVACETMVTTGQVIVAGEVKSNAYVDIQGVVRETIKEIGYTNPELKFDGESCGILVAIHEQSPDINQGVERENLEEQGAGDQGMMFGYANNEGPEAMPLPISMAHNILQLLDERRKSGEFWWARPDAKSQVTIKYDDNGKAESVDTIVVSVQHSPEIEQGEIKDAIKSVINELETYYAVFGYPNVADLLARSDYKLYVNPTGKFVLGGPAADTGLTGRKIIVDTYGGKGAHGGGAFSGKDPSKVDRSAAYMMRYIAKNMVVAGIADEMLIQVSYAIGMAQPVSLYVNTYGTSHVNATDAEIADYIKEHFDMRPHDIEKRFGLRSPIYRRTASYGHFGRQCGYILNTVNGKELALKLFPWEDVDCAEKIKNDFASLKK